MRPIFYQTSVDYKRLLLLLSERKEIVCFVDYENLCMDVCLARCFPEDDRVMFGARGIEYGAYTFLHETEKFIADCERMKLQFLDTEDSGNRKAGK